MKCTLYQIRGCVGSRRYVEIENFNTKHDANSVCKKLNKENADNFGLSLAGYYTSVHANEGSFIVLEPGREGRFENV